MLFYKRITQYIFFNFQIRGYSEKYMPSVSLQPIKPKLSSLQTFLKEIEAKKNKGKELKKGWKTEIINI